MTTLAEYIADFEDKDKFPRPTARDPFIIEKNIPHSNRFRNRTAGAALGLGTLSATFYMNNQPRFALGAGFLAAVAGLLSAAEHSRNSNLGKDVTLLYVEESRGQPLLVHTRVEDFDPIETIESLQPKPPVLKVQTNVLAHESTAEREFIAANADENFNDDRHKGHSTTKLVLGSIELTRHDEYVSLVGEKPDGSGTYFKVGALYNLDSEQVDAIETLITRLNEAYIPQPINFMAAKERLRSNDM